MIDKQQMIQRHKNPLGLALRVATYFMIGYGLWSHKTVLILVLLLIDLLNWFFMPPVIPENESKIIATIVKHEIAWLKSPLDITKFISILVALTLCILIVIGLWHHCWPILVAALGCLIVLKQLLLKSVNPG